MSSRTSIKSLCGVLLKNCLCYTVVKQCVGAGLSTTFLCFVHNIVVNKRCSVHYVRESEDLMEDAKEVVENALDSCLERNITDWGKIKNTVKDALSDFLWKRTKRSPMILPIIMEA